MRIGIDARVLGTSRALDYYTRNIIDSLVTFDKKNDYLILFSNEKQISLLKTKPEYKVIPEKVVFKDHFSFKAVVKDLSFDLMFHPDNTEFLNCIDKSVVTLHDVLPWKFPDLILAKNYLAKLRQNLYFKLQTQALKRSSKIITVSQNSKKDIVEFLKVPQDLVEVTYEGVDERFDKAESSKEILKKYGIEGDYIFYIGGLEAHKNVEKLVEAFSLLDNGLKLVIGGKTQTSELSGQNNYQKLLALIKDKSLTQKVIFTGFIEDRDLPSLYRMAKVFVYPSLYEGFGLPPLEALRSGVPVIVSKEASLPEVVGEDALLIDPRDTLNITMAIKEILGLSEAKRSEIVKKGKEQSYSFSWKKTADKTIEIFNSIV